MAARAAAGSRSRGRCRPGSGRRRSRGSRCRGAPTTPTPTASRRASATRRTSASRPCRVRRSSTPCRLVPDVSAQADEFTGAITVYEAAFGGWGTIGGTSSSTPIWAAMLALINASPTCAAHAATRGGVGFVSPLLYAVASRPGRLRGVVQRHHRRQQRRLRPRQRPGVPCDDRLRPGVGPGLAAADRPGRHRRARLLPVQPRPASRAGRWSRRLSPPVGQHRRRRAHRDHRDGIRVGRRRRTWRRSRSAPRRSRRADFTVRSATTIVATLPPARDARPPLAPVAAGRCRAGRVIVTLNDGAVERPRARARSFEYVDTSGRKSSPAITGVIPYGGPESAPGPVTILGSGFTGATSVTFGGVGRGALHGEQPLPDHRDPARRTRRAPHARRCPPRGVFAGENATNDICQVQVRVANTHGTSAAGRILPPDEGPVARQLARRAGGRRAAAAARPSRRRPSSTIVPAPSITSVSTSAGAASLASENGGTVHHRPRRGLRPADASTGPTSATPAEESSMDTGYVFLTGTEMQIAAPGQALTIGPLGVPFSVKTLAGQSAPGHRHLRGRPEGHRGREHGQQHRRWTAPTAPRTPAGPRSRSAARGSPAS